MVIGKAQSDSFTELGETLETNYSLTTLAVTIRRDIKDESISLRNLLIYEDEMMVRNELRQIEELNNKVIGNIHTLAPHADKEESIRIMEELEVLTEEWQLYQQDIIAAVLADDRPEASRIMNEHGTGIQDDIHDLVGELTVYLENHMYDLLETENEGINRQAVYVSMILSLLTGIIILFLLRFTWSFSSRLHHVSYIMSGITKGELDLTTKVQITGDDEIDWVAESFNQMTDSLEENTDRLEERNKELTEAKQSLEEKAKQLELSSKYKSEFLANMSHELRTPLNSMVILSRLLAENKEATLTVKQIEYAETIHTSANTLHEIINDILDLSKIEYGNMKVNPVVVSLKEIADEMELHFNPVAKDKELTYEVHLGKDVPEMIHTDDIKLKQVLRNLIANALKFTEKGRVKLEIARADTSPSTNPIIRFSVSDTGIGIAEENHGLVFQAFQQEDAGTSRKYGGTGLGLSITKEMVKLLNGEITLESKQGKGTTFSVFIGNYKENDKGNATSEMKLAKQAFREVKDSYVEAYGDFSDKRALLIDNNIENIYKLISIVEEHGIEIQFAADGQEALERLDHDTTIDLIFIYVTYLEANGYEILREIREIDFYKNVPILVLTTVEQEQHIHEVIDAGASDYILKPIEVQQLFEVMQRYLPNNK